MANTNGPSPQHTAQVLVDRGREALRAGQRRRARRYFTTAVANDLTCVAAWWGLADLTAKPHTALRYLQRAQALAPDDASLRWAIRRAQGQIQQAKLVRRPPLSASPDLSPAQLEPYPSQWWRWVIAGLILLALLVMIVVAGLTLAPGISAQGISPRWPPGSSSRSPVTAPAPLAEVSHKPARSQLPAPSAASLMEAGRAALAAEEWPHALTLLEAARRAAPGNQAATSVLYQATLDWGHWHAAHDRYRTAIICFDRAQALAPDNLDPARARRQAMALCRGRNAMLRENWAEAIAALAPIYVTDPVHPRVVDWLYQAYCQRGRELEEQGQWSSAKAVYTSALKVQPQGQEARLGLARAQKEKPVPQSTAPDTSLTGKWIDIDLSQQTLTAYQGSTPLLRAVVSTGIRYYPTPTGRFAIQRKYRFTHMSGPGYSLPNVPYAMFFVGGYAIHGTYWHNNFGTPMSHGCVNMRTDQAGWLYDWAPKGTPVVIHR